MAKIRYEQIQDINTVTEKLAPISGDFILGWDTVAGEVSIFDVNNLPGGGGGASQLSDLTDVNTSTPTNRNVLVADGVDWESRALVEADISDLQAYLTTETDPIYSAATVSNIVDGTGFLKNNGAGVWSYDNSTYAEDPHTHTLTNITDVTATAAEVNLLDLSALTAGWALVADTATTASWQQIDHVDLANIGTNTHAQIDTHIADSTIHFTQASISITESQISDLGAYVDATGSPANTYLARFTDADTITGDDEVIWNGTNLIIKDTTSSGTSVVYEVDDTTTTAGVKMGILNLSGTGFPGIWFNVGTISTTNFAFLAGSSSNTIFNTPGSTDMGFRVNNAQKIALWASGGVSIGDAIADQSSGTDPGADNLLVGGTIAVDGGLSTQFLKADGSLDSSTYLTNITGETLSDLSDIPVEPTGGAAEYYLKYDDNTDTFSWVDITTLGGASFTDIDTDYGAETVTSAWTMNALTLGGNLDVLTHSITTSTLNGDVTLTANGTGTVTLGSDLDNNGNNLIGSGDLNITGNIHGEGFVSTGTAAGLNLVSAMGDHDNNHNNFQVRVTNSTQILEMGDINATQNGNRIVLNDNLGTLTLGDDSAVNNKTYIKIDDANAAVSINSSGSVVLGDVDNLTLALQTLEINNAPGKLGFNLDSFNVIQLGDISNAGNNLLVTLDDVNSQITLDNRNTTVNYIVIDDDYIDLQSQRGTGNAASISINNTAGADGSVSISASDDLNIVANNIYLNTTRNITGISTKSITIESPTSSEDIGLFFTDDAITVTQINAVQRGTTPSVTYTIRHSTDRSAAGNEVVTSGSTTTSTTTGDEVTVFNDATIPAGSWVWLETTAQSGTSDELTITIEYITD